MGVFPLVDALRSKGAEVLVHDPMYSDSEITGFGWARYHVGDTVDAVVIQADHAQYADLSASDLPGIKAIVDGRKVTDAGRFEGISHRVIGLAVSGA